MRSSSVKGEHTPDATDDARDCGSVQICTHIGEDVPEVTTVEAPKLASGALARGNAPAMGTSLARGAVLALSASGVAAPELAGDTGGDGMARATRAVAGRSWRARAKRYLRCDTESRARNGCHKQHK